LSLVADALDAMAALQTYRDDEGLWRRVEWLVEARGDIDQRR
jgi:hypothetical protein